jgi:hypothetical protein
MLTGTDVMSKPLWVAMSDDEWKSHVSALLRHLERVDELEAQRAAVAKKFKEYIDDEMDEVQRLRRVLTDDGQQMTLAEATVDNDPNIVAQEDATEALAAVAEAAEQLAPQFHAKGDRCKREHCKRRHLTAEQLRANEIEPEGPPKCSGCAAELTAIEIVKKLGLCETCQVQPEAPGIFEYEEQRERGVFLKDIEDPPHCSRCLVVLNLAEAAQDLGMCERCADETDEARP